VTRTRVSAESFGTEVLGPIFAEFSLRLWSVLALLRSPDEVVALFCARGGLRMQQAYETFLRASELPTPVRLAPLMVSRLAAVRPALLRTVEQGRAALPAASAATLTYEFPGSSLADVAEVTSGTAPRPSRRWAAEFTPRGFADLLHHRDGEPVVAALAQQTRLFTRHLTDAMDGRRRGVLVDTGLFGTTAHLLADGFEGLDLSSVLIARSNYRRAASPPHAKVFGLSVQADGYSPLHRRTAMLRYWHFIESLFEPRLDSVQTFTEVGGHLRSNLEVDGWQDQLHPTPGSLYAGLLEYLASLPAGPAAQVLRDADKGWDRFRRAVVWPDPAHGFALRAGQRSWDFGSDVTFTDRIDRGAIAAFRGSSMWREGEIARSGSVLRLPLLLAIEGAHSFRRLKRLVDRVRPG
jgi:hypothetical protein